MSWKTKSTKEVYRNKYMWITEDKVETGFGKKLTYGVVHKKPFVLIIPQTKGNKLVLVKLYRYPIKKFSWEFPQGHFESGSFIETAEAELNEETGFTAKSMNQIGSFFVGPGFLSQECKIFLAVCLSNGKQDLEPAEEGIKIKKLTISQIKSMIRNGKIMDGPTISAFEIFIEHKQKN